MRLLNRISNQPLVFWAILFLPFICLSPAEASEFRADNDAWVEIDEVVRDDLYLFGNDVEVRGDIEGDLSSFSYSLISNGEIFDDANIFAYDADITGRVGGSFRIFAYNTRINSSIDGNLIAMSQWLRVRDQTVIEKDLHFLAERFDFDGTVKGNLSGGGANIKIAGTVYKDVDIEAERLIVVAPTVIKGDLRYKSSEEALIEDGVIIEGDVEWRKTDVSSKDIEEEAEKIVSVVGVGFDIAFFVMAFITGTVLLLVFRDHAGKASDEVLNRPWYSLAVGILAFIILCGGSIISAVLIIGIPLSLIMIMLGLTLFYIGKIYAAVPLGKWILKMISKDSETGIILEFLVGLIVLAILFQIPFLGMLIYIAAFLIGAGAIVVAFMEMRKKTVVESKSIQ